MSFFELDNIQRVTRGRWQQAPQQSSVAPVVGIGIDTRANLDRRAFIALRGDRHDGHTFLHEAASRGAGLLIVQDGCQADLPAGAAVLSVDDTCAALIRLAAAYRQTTLSSATVIAITGSCGKTTTKRLLHAALGTVLPGTSAPKSFNNKIGVPLTMLAAQPDDRYLILELGTNAPGEIQTLAQLCRPDIAIITSIGQSHLQGLESIEGVAREKAALLRSLRGGFAIINADAPAIAAFVPPHLRVISFGESASADLRLTNYGRDHERWWFEVENDRRFRLQLPGRHNAVNALAAIAAARHMGISHGQIARGLDDVSPEAMRLCVEEVGGATLLNDAYNANPESTAAALSAFAELTSDVPTGARRILILGEMHELGNAAAQLHAEVGRRILELDETYPIHRAILIGPLCRHLARELATKWPSDRILQLDELSPSSMSAILKHISPGDFILLKGSRRAALERIAEALQRKHSVTVSA